MCGVAGVLALFAAPLSSVTAAQQSPVTAQVQLVMKSAAKPAAARDAAASRADVVVWLEPLGADDRVTPSVPSPSANAQIIQHDKTFVPHVTVVTTGTVVQFPNKDPFFHNVFSLFEGKRFDLGLYEAGSSRTVAFNRAGISYIFCNIHPEMSAVVVTLKTPYYAISDRKGMVTIPNVPPGRYQMQIWHEQVLPETLSNLTRTVSISVQTSSLGVLRLPKQRNLSPLHKNKYGQDYTAPPKTGYSRPGY